MGEQDRSNYFIQMDNAHRMEWRVRTLLQLLELIPDPAHKEQAYELYYSSLIEAQAEGTREAAALLDSINAHAHKEGRTLSADKAQMLTNLASSIRELAARNRASGKESLHNAPWEKVSGTGN